MRRMLLTLALVLLASRAALAQPVIVQSPPGVYNTTGAITMMLPQSNADEFFFEVASNADSSAPLGMTQLALIRRNGITTTLYGCLTSSCTTSTYTFTGATQYAICAVEIAQQSGVDTVLMQNNFPAAVAVTTPAINTFTPELALGFYSSNGSPITFTDTADNYNVITSTPGSLTHPIDCVLTAANQVAAGTTSDMGQWAVSSASSSATMGILPVNVVYPTPPPQPPVFGPLTPYWIFGFSDTATVTDSVVQAFFDKSSGRTPLYHVSYNHPPPANWNVVGWLKYDNLAPNAFAVHTPSGLLIDCPYTLPLTPTQVNNCKINIGNNPGVDKTIPLVYLGYDLEQWNFSPCQEWSTVCNGSTVMAGTYSSSGHYVANVSAVQCTGGTGQCSVNDGKIYLSLTGTTNDPVTHGTDWRLVTVSVTTIEASFNTFCSIAHALGYKCFVTPANTLFVTQVPSLYPTAPRGIIGSGIMAYCGTVADWCHAQLQGYEKNLNVGMVNNDPTATFQWYCAAAVNQVYAVSPLKLASCGISTANTNGGTPSPEQVAAAVTQSPQMVQWGGWWFNYASANPAAFSQTLCVLYGVPYNASAPYCVLPSPLPPEPW